MSRRPKFNHPLKPTAPGRAADGSIALCLVALRLIALWGVASQLGQRIFDQRTQGFCLKSAGAQIGRHSEAGFRSAPAQLRAFCLAKPDSNAGAFQVPVERRGWIFGVLEFIAQAGWRCRLRRCQLTGV
jgi:hypothetical protein